LKITCELTSGLIPGKTLDSELVKKAFDRIGHNLLILKLLDLGVRSSLLPWIKLGGKTSDWLPMNAGVPQGTKLSPILFLAMINDLDVKTHATDIWKFVDDISTSEISQKAAIQSFNSALIL
jgi:retron-type reverse transcriptase